MSKYVDIDILIEKTEKLIQKFYDRFPESDFFLDEELLLHLLNCAKENLSIDIVRCKYCKYYGTECCYMDWLIEGTKPDDYCSRGERIENNEPTE